MSYRYRNNVSFASGMSNVFAKEAFFDFGRLNKDFLFASTCLIDGESGTGKELIARAIHYLSSRGQNPFIADNRGALPDTLLESEIFGYQKGAINGVSKDKPGRFELAEGGLYFLMRLPIFLRHCRLSCCV